MRRDSPFVAAVVLAFLLHTGLGIVLRNHRMAVANAANPAARPPVTLRFMEVPPVTREAPVTPNTNNASDKNRIAGPLERAEQAGKGEERRMRSEQPGEMRENRGMQGAANQAPPQVLPDVNLEESQGPADVEIQNQHLAQSLNNLDKFIAPGSGGEEDDSGGGIQGDPGSGVFFDTRGFDLGPWSNRVIAIVKSNWLIPVAANLGSQGIVSIAFQVQRDGTLTDFKITSPSGVISFDQAALNALKTSNPFPPLPVDFPRPALPAVFRFYYNMPVPR